MESTSAAEFALALKAAKATSNHVYVLCTGAKKDGVSWCGVRQPPARTFFACAGGHRQLGCLTPILVVATTAASSHRR